MNSCLSLSVKTEGYKKERTQGFFLFYLQQIFIQNYLLGWILLVRRACFNWLQMKEERMPIAINIMLFSSSPFYYDIDLSFAGTRGTSGCQSLKPGICPGSPDTCNTRISVQSNPSVFIFIH